MEKSIPYSVDIFFFATAPFMKLCVLLSAIEPWLVISLAFYGLSFQALILVLSLIFVLLEVHKNKEFIKSAKESLLKDLLISEWKKGNDNEIIIF